MIINKPSSLEILFSERDKIIIVNIEKIIKKEEKITCKGNCGRIGAIIAITPK